MEKCGETRDRWSSLLRDIRVEEWYEVLRAIFRDNYKIGQLIQIQRKMHKTPHLTLLNV